MLNESVDIGDATPRHRSDMRISICLVILFVARAALADEPARAYSVNGRLSDTYTDFPIDGALVYVTGPKGLERTVDTDENGHYLASVDGPGTYYLTFTLGPKRIGYKVEIANPGSTHFDARLERDEVIEIHDIPRRRPPTMPAPVHRLGLIPQYSDALVETDVWVKAWMLLDIDEHGTVARAKFLNRPGHDLDQIAMDHALRLKFTPALDDRGHAIRTMIIYPIEWPSYWWMVGTQGFTVRMPEPEAIWRVPCRGSGPLHLDSIDPVYRDCSKPDISHLDREAWYSLRR